MCTLPLHVFLNDEVIAGHAGLYGHPSIVYYLNMTFTVDIVAPVICEHDMLEPDVSMYFLVI